VLALLRLTKLVLCVGGSGKELCLVCGIKLMFCVERLHAGFDEEGNFAGTVVRLHQRPKGFLMLSGRVCADIRFFQV
jgi:hypothetical protein